MQVEAKNLVMKNKIQRFNRNVSFAAGDIVRLDEDENDLADRMLPNPQGNAMLSTIVEDKLAPRMTTGIEAFAT